DLAIDRDASLGQLADELRVGEAVITDRGVDAHDPEAAEVPLAVLAPIEHVPPGMADCFERGLPIVVAATAEALGVLQDAVAAAPRFKSTFSARHKTDSLLGSVRKHQANLMLLRLVHHGTAAQTALPLGRFLRQDMALVRLSPLEMAL